jgi:anti-anti-sigma factor
VYCISEDVVSGSVDCGVDVAVVVVSGELDYGASPRLRECLFGHIRAGGRHIVVDLSAVTFIDSTAIGVLVAAVTGLRESGGGSLAVVCAEENDRVLRIFDIAGVASVLALYRSAVEALLALATVRPSDVASWMEQMPRSTAQR